MKALIAFSGNNPSLPEKTHASAQVNRTLAYKTSSRMSGTPLGGSSSRRLSQIGRELSVLQRGTVEVGWVR